MSLKNEKYYFNILVIVFYLFSFKAYSATEDKTEVISYLSSLSDFSASFIQSDGENLSEGRVYIGKKRVRAEYFLPTKILIILAENKAMYYDYVLEEDEFFNPKNTNAWFFYDIFRNPLFFEDGKIETKNNELILEKKGIDNKEKNFVIKILFEKNPLVLRGIEVEINDEILKLSIYNHNYNEDFDKNFFKLINPNFLN
jgi:outer membrane lipoprotein-sorting protein